MVAPGALDRGGGHPPDGPLADVRPGRLARTVAIHEGEGEPLDDGTR